MFRSYIIFTIEIIKYVARFIAVIHINFFFIRAAIVVLTSLFLEDFVSRYLISKCELIKDKVVSIT